MDLARAPRRRPLTARKKGSGYENGISARQVALALASRFSRMLSFQIKDMEFTGITRAIDRFRSRTRTLKTT